jgi:4-hydroxy-4-methyl-2-oxoglutarate aldolase
VLVVQAGGAPLAALGELLATEAWRRGLGGIVVDGYVRDRSGLPPELPLWARGSVPMAGRSDVAPRVGGPILFGGVRVSSGDVVVGDDDGLVIGPRAQLEACLERAAEIERVEAAVLAGVQGGQSLIEMTNLAEHVARLRAGERSSLAISPPG